GATRGSVSGRATHVRDGERGPSPPSRLTLRLPLRSPQYPPNGGMFAARGPATICETATEGTGAELDVRDRRTSNATRPPRLEGRRHGHTPDSAARHGRPNPPGPTPPARGPAGVCVPRLHRRGTGQHRDDQRQHGGW